MIIKRLFQLFYPELCLLCEQPLIAGEEQICLRCLLDLPRTDFHRRADNPVEQLFRGRSTLPVEHATAHLHFVKGGKTQRLVHALKYHNNPELGYTLGRLMARELQAVNHPLAGADLLLPVPLHARKLRHRGYNQSEWLARGIASLLPIPIERESLVRTHHNDSQTGKEAPERWDNVCSIFHVIQPERLRGRFLVLVDDVITTGATICSCIEALSAVPDVRVGVLSLSATQN